MYMEGGTATSSTGEESTSSTGEESAREGSRAEDVKTELLEAALKHVVRRCRPCQPTLNLNHAEWLQGNSRTLL